MNKLLKNENLLVLFTNLPIDLKLKCFCVCRKWRYLLSYRSIIHRLNLGIHLPITLLCSEFDQKPYYYLKLKKYSSKYELQLSSMSIYNEKPYKMFTLFYPLLSRL